VKLDAGDSIASLRTTLHEAPPLAPPATTAELRWWEYTRVPIRNRMFLRTALPFLAVWLVTNWLKYSKFSIGLMIFLALMAAAAGWLQWAVTESKLRDQSIRWKRIRDDLNASAS
jgi:hypothetical protein